MVTDQKRLMQVLKNLLSNAFKFTAQGGVQLRVAMAIGGWNREHPVLRSEGAAVAFEVTDTGIGIPAEKQQIVFEAFQQADGSTSRRFGGTGLGLAISREIATLLGGEIRLASVPGEGSTFTLYLPQAYAPVKAAARPEAGTPGEEAARLLSSVEAVRTTPIELEPAAPEVADDRDEVEPGDRVLLIVDNDEHFARYLLEVARDNGWRGIVATRGAEAVSLARERRLDAITLDILLPDIDGWRVLDRLKGDPSTRHIPVQVITTEDEAGRGLKLGAKAVLQKPVQSREVLEEMLAGLRGFLDRHRRDLLVVAPGAAREGLLELVPQIDVETRVVEPEAGPEAVESGSWDCVVALLEGGEAERLGQVEALVRRCEAQEVPVVLYTPGELPDEAEAVLHRLNHVPVLKRVASPERLVDQTALFLHRPIEELHESRRRAVERLYDTTTVLAGKKVLIVDDDIRNIFAISSVLERYNMRVVAAETGKQAIGLVEETADLDIVLMDIMMPDMDGYQTMRAIRQQTLAKNLPIVAVTAKAMKGDREKTLEAGAWDYLAKPVDTEHMLSVLRAWLYR